MLLYFNPYLLCQESKQLSQQMKQTGSRRYTEKEIREACTADELFNMVETAVDPDVIQVFIHLFNMCYYCCSL